jgi:hypothetical protein
VDCKGTLLHSLESTTLSWARWIHSTSFHSLSLRFILMLSSQLYLGLPSSFFPPGFPTKIPSTFLMVSMHAICPSHVIFFHLITLIILLKSTNYENLLYRISSSLQIFSTPCSYIKEPSSCNVYYTASCIKELICRHIHLGTRTHVSMNFHKILHQLLQLFHLGG